jgi:hypothetical protein
MFTRNVMIGLKPDCAPEFTRLIENEVLPLLRKQPGFLDQLSLVAPEGLQALAISFWDTQANAEAYNRTAYPHVLKALVKVIEGTPKITTFVISNSTFHKIAAKAA